MLKRFFTSRSLPFWIFHVPIIPYYLFLSAKSRTLSFFTNINPSWNTGGFINSSKIDALKDIDSKWLPHTLYFDSNVEIQNVLTKLYELDMRFPVILKPNHGERGKGVTKIYNEGDMVLTIQTINCDFIIQEFIDFPIEIGILYYKNPITSQSGITSLTIKELPFVIGDGKSSLAQLVKKKYGSKYFTDIQHDINRNEILKFSEKKIIGFIAHRNKRCVFRSLHGLVDVGAIIPIIEEITKNMPYFHFGRFDVKIKQIADLFTGENLKILELNGVNSQPIHIFDPDYSFYRCYKDLHKHWKLIYDLSISCKNTGLQPISTSKFINELIKKYKDE